MSIHPRPSQVRRGLASLAALLLALLAGCGPTTGGTGTGDSSLPPLSDFGARPASTCSAGFAASLSCDVVSASPVDPAQLQGTAPVVFSGTAASGTYVMTVQANRVELQSRCQASRFEGDWGVRPDGEARFFGSWTGPERQAAVPAQLWVQAIQGVVDSLQVLVLDSDGRALFGPLPMRRVAKAPAEDPTCP